MAFIEKSDLLDFITSAELDTVSNTDDTIIDTAIGVAEEELKGYMRHRYKVDTIFAQSSTNRDAKLKQVCIDVTLYHLFCRVAPRNIPETRIQRYDDSVKWLKMVQKGTIMMDLERITSTTDTQIGERIRYGNATKPW